MTYYIASSSGKMSPLSQSPTLNDSPSQSLFMTYIIDEIPDQWRKFGIHLNIKFNQLKAIPIVEKSPEMCFLEVYSIWEREMEKPFTWQTAVDVLGILKHKRLQRNVIQKLAGQSPLKA